MARAEPDQERSLETAPGILGGLAEGFLGLAYPKMCAGCAAPLEATGAHRQVSGVFPGDEDEEQEPCRYGKWLCEGCEDRLEPIAPPFCSICGNIFHGRASVEFRCANCSQRHLWFDFARSAYQAEGLTRELIHRFKYEERQELRGLLGAMLGRALESDPRLAAAEAGGWVLTPVPLHWRRYRERGYNQAWELCLTLRRHHPGLGLAPVLRRLRHTGKQANLQRDDRLKNPLGAFGLSLWPGRRKLAQGRTVLLVDDVLTTGATLSECSRVLLQQAGARRVIALTLARG